MEYIKTHKLQTVAAFIVLLLIPIGVYLALNPTVFKPRAAETKLLLQGPGGSNQMMAVPGRDPNRQDGISLILEPGDREIAGFDAVLSYDPNLLEIRQEDLNVLEASFPFLALLDASSGTVKISALAYNQQSPKDSKLVTTRVGIGSLKFKLKTNQAATLSVDNSSVVANKVGDNVLGEKGSITIRPQTNIGGITPYTCNVFEAYHTDGQSKDSYTPRSDITYIAKFKITGWSSNDQTILQYLSLYDNADNLNIVPICSNRVLDPNADTSDWTCSWEGIKVGAAGNHDLRAILRDSSISAPDRTACAYENNSQVVKNYLSATRSSGRNRADGIYRSRDVTYTILPVDPVVGQEITIKVSNATSKGLGNIAMMYDRVTTLNSWSSNGSDEWKVTFLAPGNHRIGFAEGCDPNAHSNEDGRPECSNRAGYYDDMIVFLSNQ